ncbi:MAG TPA: GGDEF domain-containing protein [Sedimenticola sp.]|nr:GGDEF domain-containing protein [Sedimenticola sp.]
MFSSEFHQAVIRLTAQCNQHQLIRKMADDLVGLGLAEHVEYYEFYDREGNKFPDITEATLHSLTIRNLLDEHDRGRSIRELPQVMPAILAQEPASFDTQDAAGNVRNNMVLPVINREQVVGLIVLRDHNVRGSNLEYIEFFQRIFSNIIALVWSKERDVLTGLFNRQAFEQRFLNILKFATDSRRQNAVISANACLALLDIDHFKKVNDEWGHLIGDEVLLHFSQLLGRSFRYYDLSCRYGGEEFAVVLRGTDLATAVPVLERFRTAVERYEFPKVGQKTVSIGVSEVRPQELLTTVIERADKALYYAKEHGRNQVQAYELITAIDESEAIKSSDGDIELF